MIRASRRLLGSKRLDAGNELLLRLRAAVVQHALAHTDGNALEIVVRQGYLAYYLPLGSIQRPLRQKLIDYKWRHS